MLIVQKNLNLESPNCKTHEKLENTKKSLTNKHVILATKQNKKYNNNRPMNTMITEYISLYKKKLLFSACVFQILIQLRFIIQYCFI